MVGLEPTCSIVCRSAAIEPLTHFGIPRTYLSSVRHNLKPYVFSRVLGVESGSV